MPFPKSVPARTPRSRVLLGIALVVVLGVGVYVGLHSTRGTKQPRTATGIAMRANSENDLVMFDADDGTQLDFGADSIWWESESSSGDGDPPCLREPLEKVDVEVGYLRVAGPDGGWREVAVWVQCL